MSITLDLANRLAYSPAEAGKLIGLSRSAVYQAMARGELRARKFGTRTLIARDELERFVSALPAADLAKPA